MSFPGDPRPNQRTRSVVLLGGGVLLVFALLGTLEWFNTSKVDFLNPETYGQTIFLTALESLLFLLLLLLLVLLFRTVFKVYVGQASSGVATRLRSRMVLGAVIITLTPAALMCLFSYYLMNRSLERWFSPNSSQLRDDSTRIVVELADYVAGNARGEAESIAASGAPDQPLAQFQQIVGAHRVTLQGGFVQIYDKDRHAIANFQAPAESTPVTLLSGADSHDRGTPIRVPLSAALRWAAQR